MNNSYYLPEVYQYNESVIGIEYIDNKEEEKLKTINKSLMYYLTKIKLELDYLPDWDSFKKLTYQYEYINTKLDKTHKSVCQYEPISRAYFKLYEIIKHYNVLNNEEPIKTFHLAEGPGGFIEACATYRENRNDKYYGITLINSDKATPKWNKAQRILNKYKNISIIYGEDKTGNLFNKKNLLYCINRFENSMDFITGDGGFDYSIDFNKQELLSVNLIFVQVIYGLFLQKKGGSMVIKIFDIFRENTIDIIYLLTIFYKKVSITKPDTSRSANSEKYIVCEKKRRNFTIKEKNHILRNIENIKIKMLKKCVTKEPTYHFMLKIEEINSILGQQQLENINQTLNMIYSVPSNSYVDYEKKNKDKIQICRNNNIQKCIKWCEKNNFKYNTVR